MNSEQTPERFEDRLLVELNAIVARNPSPVSAQEPAPRRRPRPARRFAFAGGIALALAAAVAVVAATSGTPDAYAVEKSGDGAISVEVHSLSDAAGLEARLREAGVIASVNYNAGSSSCVAPDAPPPRVLKGEPKRAFKTESRVAGEAGGGEKSLSVAPGGTPPPAVGAEGPGGIAIEQTADGVKFTITPGSLPKDGRLVIDANAGGGLHSLGVAIVKGAGPAPECK